MVNAPQVIQYKATRSIAMLSIFTPIKVLLKTCGWMSVSQLMVYHSLVLLQKTLAQQSPLYLYEKVTAAGQFPYKTKQAAVCPAQFSFDVQHPTDSDTVRLVSSAKLGISKKGWCWRSVEMYNLLPSDIRLEKKLTNFKKRLKDWVTLNTSI